MFGTLPIFVSPLPPSVPPEDVPPPTPIRFPRYFPELTGEAPVAAAGEPASHKTARKPLTAVLQSIVRPTEIDLPHFQALGVRIRENATLPDLIPDHDRVVPDFAAWDAVPYDEARTRNEATGQPLSNGKRSPGIQTYLDRTRELSIDNSAAFRSVRRLQPRTPGLAPVRLGNAYEFYRHLESFSAFWDDTSLPPLSSAKEAAGSAKAGSSKDGNASRASSSAEGASKDGEAAADSGDNAGDKDTGDTDSVSSASSAAVTTDSESKPPSPAKDGNGGSGGSGGSGAPAAVPEIRFYRLNTGTQMPPEYRLNILTAFLKLVAYDFGCNVSAPRTEPRLYLNTGTVPAGQADEEADREAAAAATRKAGPSFYFSSGCIFLFRSPTTRDAARAGIVEGPLAAVSARHTTTFGGDGDTEVSPSDKDCCIDLARELVAALLTAQHRAREGRAERRIGAGAWWTTRPRWGGGPGGPIGREVDAAPNTDESVGGDSLEGAGSGGGSGSGGGAARRGSSGAAGPSRRVRPPAGGGNPSGLSGLQSLGALTGMPVRPGGASASSGGGGGGSASAGSAKKPRKGLAIYDNYRMVRPPSASWDKKTRYLAVGRSQSAAYDDVFVISALFHHVSIVRVRVPLRLLRRLDGEEEEEEEHNKEEPLEVVRSPWFDLFRVEDRLAAIRVVWGMLAYMMRKEDAGAEGDVKMGDA